MASVAETVSVESPAAAHSNLDIGETAAVAAFAELAPTELPPLLTAEPVALVAPDPAADPSMQAMSKALAEIMALSAEERLAMFT